MRRVPAHLAIGGKTPKPQRPCTSSTRERGSLKVAVFIRLGYKPVVLPLTGTKDAGVPVSDEWAPRRRLGMTEYTARVKEALAELGLKDGPAAGTRGAPLVLLHDRDPAHTGSIFLQWAEQKGFKVVQLPRSCPDLTPSPPWTPPSSAPSTAAG